MSRINKQREILADIAPDFKRDGESAQEYILKKRDSIVSFIKNYVFNSKASGIVLGVSGGIDSFLVGALCADALVGSEKDLYLLILPKGEQSDYADALCATEQIKKIYDNAKIDTLSIEPAFLATVNEISSSKLFSDDIYLLANIQPRLRMVYQYALAKGMLVAGTDHATEAVTGFYTKYGDGGTDFNPIQELVKDDIYEMSKLYDVDKALVEKQPAAGIGISVDDASELNMKYKDICAYLKGNVVKKEVRERLEAAYDRSCHKRKMPASLKDEYEKTAQVTHIHIGKVGDVCASRTTNYINAHSKDIVLYVEPSNSNEKYVVKKTVNSKIAHYNCFYRAADGKITNENFGELFDNVVGDVKISGEISEILTSVVQTAEEKGYTVTLITDCLQKQVTK